MAAAQNVTGLNMFYKTTGEEILSKCKTFADVKCAKKAESFTSFIGPRISRRQKKKEFGGGGGRTDDRPLPNVGAAAAAVRLR